LDEGIELGFELGSLLAQSGTVNVNTSLLVFQPSLVSSKLSLVNLVSSKISMYPSHVDSVVSKKILFAAFSLYSPKTYVDECGVVSLQVESVGSTFIFPPENDSNVQQSPNTTDLKVLPKNPSLGHAFGCKAVGYRLGKELCMLVGSALGVNDGMLLGVDEGSRVGNLLGIML
jgi:hypothetical protein